MYSRLADSGPCFNIVDWFMLYLIYVCCMYIFFSFLYLAVNEVDYYGFVWIRKLNIGSA